MIGLSTGHGVKHFCQGAFLLLIPGIKSTLGLSDVAVGGIFTAQQISSGTANAPAGLLTDMFRRRVVWFLTVSMILVGLAYFMIGIAPWYGLIIAAVVSLGAGTSLWHSPAFATLAARYPERRGLAMSAHLTGAQAGDSVAPIVTGFVLGGFTLGAIAWGGWDWRTVALLLVVPAGMTAVVVATRFRSAATGVPPQISLPEYGRALKRLVGNGSVLGMVGLQAMRNAVHQSFRVFLVLYLSDVLGYNPFIVGLHISLLTLAGVASTPVMGAISDRVGRRPIMALGLAAMTGLLVSFIWIESGWPLGITLGFLGVFLFAVNPIITAAAMDATDRGSEGSAIAMMFAGGSVVGSFAPVVAGAINSQWEFQGVVIFVAAIATFGVVLSLILPMRNRDAAAA